jgi:hypothetical protein
VSKNTCLGELPACECRTGPRRLPRADRTTNLRSTSTSHRPTRPRRLSPHRLLTQKHAMVALVSVGLLIATIAGVATSGNKGRPTPGVLGLDNYKLR